MFKGSILSFLLIGSILSSEAESNDFRYPNEDENESNFTWSGKCETGKRQSPIEIITKNAQRIKQDNLIFGNYDEDFKSAEIVNNGHTVHIHNFSKKLTVKGGILKEGVIFVLDQVHFHWPSEHVIDNQRYSLEMHLVHRNLDYENMSEALNSSNEGILVLAVLFRAGEMEYENKALNEIFEKDMIGRIRDHTEINKNFQIEGDFHIQDLMPAEKDDDYFTYIGSLTTPPCTESVRWIVFNDYQFCSLQQLEILDDIEDKDGVKIPMNSRYLQKTGQRSVFYVIDDEGDADDKEDNDDKDDDKDDKENKVEQNVSSSIRYSAGPMTVLITLLLLTIGNFKH